MRNAIEVQDLTKAYGRNAVLRELSFSVREGEVFALLGVNGAGKTTTLECIEGLRKADSGHITVCDFDVPKELSSVQKVLGVQLQSTSLPETMTSKEAMRLFCVWHKVPFRLDLLERFDMAGEHMNKQYSNLSAGRKRRLHLALALCHNPRVLILDEPTAGLDVEGRDALHKQIKQLKTEGVSILIATHDMAEAEKLSDTIAILRDGVIAKQGSPRELTASADIQSRIIIKTLNGSLKDFLTEGIVPKPDILEDDYFSFASKDAAELLLLLLTHIRKANDEVVDLRVQRASIEDLFLSIAGGK
ncbi:MAG: ABC transporter ATP-binding protein [Eubacteriales bacterium]|nr:ABC transporter ATP-binding protein [Eubacteriales bacterium]MDD4540738.1 ABC transporter ATP-binding protein [Eubacteriales bacterium]